MKHRNKLALFTLTALLQVPLTMLHAADKPERWTAIKANEWYAAQPWLVGCNFLPCTAVNDVEMWQKETFDPKTIDRELGWAHDLGFNTVRVFLNYVVWEADADGLKKRFDQFLTIAGKHGIRVMPILFDDCNFAGRTATIGKQPDPVPGVHNSQWVSSPPLKMITDNAIWPQLERYVKDIVSTFANDRRVVIWDLYNEPGNSGVGEKCQPLFEATFAWAREIKPTQPLTTGAWINFNAPMQQRMMELSDIISFHGYDDIKGIEAKLKICGGYGRPVLCTEWLLRQGGNNFESLLPLFRDRKIGCYNWGLVAGRTQTYFHWGSKPGSPEPALWQHDILHQDGAPFNAQEVQFIKETLDRLKFSDNGKLRDINPSLTPQPLPSVKLEPLFDFPVRDTYVCPGPDQTYYLTGTTGHPTWWKTNEGIRVWKSKDLKTWEPLGLVWSFVKNATWQKPKGDNQAIWAPELHYFKGTFWIAYCVNYGGTGILRSKTGKAEGPYEDMKPDGPLTAEIDASLFADDDGKVYFVWQNGKIARLREDMTGLAEEPRLLKPSNAKEVGFEGAFLTKINGRYHLICAAFNEHENHSTYDCMAANADSIFGPYGDAYLAIQHAGHNALFKDSRGNWWSTFFGNDPQAPFRERPAMLPIRIDSNSKIQPIY